MDWHMNRANELSISLNAPDIHVLDTIRQKLQAGCWLLRSDGERMKNRVQCYSILFIFQYFGRPPVISCINFGIVSSFTYKRTIFKGE